MLELTTDTQVDPIVAERQRVTSIIPLAAGPMPKSRRRHLTKDGPSNGRRRNFSTRGAEATARQHSPRGVQADTRRGPCITLILNRPRPVTFGQRQAQSKCSHAPLS